MLRVRIGRARPGLGGGVGAGDEAGHGAEEGGRGAILAEHRQLELRHRLAPEHDAQALGALGDLAVDLLVVDEVDRQGYGEADDADQLQSSTQRNLVRFGIGWAGFGGCSCPRGDGSTGAGWPRKGMAASGAEAARWYRTPKAARGTPARKKRFNTIRVPQRDSKGHTERRESRKYSFDPAN